MNVTSFPHFLFIDNWIGIIIIIIIIISKWNNIMSCFISSTNMTSPPALSQGEGDRADG